MKARIVGIVVAALLLAGCTQPAPVVTSARPTPTASTTPTAVAQPPLQPVGEPVTIVSGLNAPWSMVRLASGSTLISERDTAMIRELQADGSLRDVGQVPNVRPDGEGGLLGLAYTEIAGQPWLYAYFTSLDSDNRIVRFPLNGAAGSYSLGEGQLIMSGIARAGNHNGGRLAIGPDNRLYATSGDASDSGRSQDPTSLNGKILRMELDGSIPADNPIPGSYTWSYGHRNPQGITWDSQGTMWAAEFGQNTWDEINKIEPGLNYGWPLVEGMGDDPRFTNPIYIWSTDDASPSGLTSMGDTLFMAGLGGQRLWVVTPGVTDPAAFYVGQYGRIRDVVPGPDGTLWMLTNNTDGRGDPREGDDRILQVEVGPIG
jgi:glucose/arabinose dehydrogenase